jgi:hypothetical protein
MAQKVFTIYEDGGHAWAKVPRALLAKLGLLPQISQYSYERGDFVYLEEDCDLSLFCVAYPAATFRTRRSDSSRVRNYERFSHKPLFELGDVLLTRGVQDKFVHTQLAPLLERHVTGDWGLCCKEDWEVNQVALREGDRLMSVYTINDERIWVITEWNRSVTTMLLPSEY